MTTRRAESGELIDIHPYGDPLAQATSSTQVKTDELEVMRMVLPAGKKDPPTSGCEGDHRPVPERGHRGRVAWAHAPHARRHGTVCGPRRATCARSAGQLFGPGHQAGSQSIEALPSRQFNQTYSHAPFSSAGFLEPDTDHDARGRADIHRASGDRHPPRSGCSLSAVICWIIRCKSRRGTPRSRACSGTGPSRRLWCSWCALLHGLGLWADAAQHSPRPDSRALWQLKLLDNLVHATARLTIELLSSRSR